MSQLSAIKSTTQPLIKVKRSDFEKTSFFSKQFCLPKEIKLVEYNGNHSHRDSRQNIQIVDRIDPFDSNPVFRNINPIDFSSQHPEPGDGLISLAKNLNVKVAICITVYSEDKAMLKKTLEGIRKNYETFFQKAGIYSHQILIVIIFDGIQYLNNSKQSDQNMFNLFREFDLINGLRKKEYLLAKSKQYGNHDEQDESMINQLQNFADQMLFTEQQYEAIEDLLLDTQYNRYKEMTQLLEFAQDIQNKKLHNTAIHNLPPLVIQTFCFRARLYLEQNGIQDITQNNKELGDYIVQNLPQQKIDVLKLDALKDAVNVAKNYLKSRQSTAIMYQMSLSMQKQKSGQAEPKMNLFTVVKYSNKGKLSSHLWFFQGFCNMINPTACVLLDCGLEPQRDSIYKIWCHIETFKETCGGVCGYMKLRTESPYDQSGNRPQAQSQSFLTQMCNLFVDVQKAQIFEYHFSHLLDKPFESLTGYIHVLPGAFSGYNWQALKSQTFRVMRSDGQVFEKDIEKRTKQQILKKYLKTVIYNEVLDNIEEANMYLAEDRILCLEIYTKKKNRFNLQYLPDASAYVDPLTTLPKLINQRKRWINGSWFAFNYVLKHKQRVSQSEHSWWDKLWFHFNMLNAQIMKYVAYLSIAFFFVTLHLMVLQFSQTTVKNYFMRAYSLTENQLVYAKILSDFFSIRSVINSFTKIFDFVYISCIGVLVYRSLTIKRQDTNSKRSYNTIASCLGILGLVSIVLVFANFYMAIFEGQSELVNIRGLNGFFTQQTFLWLFVGIVSTHAITILTAFNIKTYIQILTSLFSYFFFVPSYVNIFFIYAFCRIDDLSWGTKGLDNESKSHEASIRRKFTDDKIKFTLTWLSTNIIAALVLIGLANNYDIQNYIIWIFSAYFAFIMAVKVLFIIIYLLKYFTIKKIQVFLMIRKTKQRNLKDGQSIKNIVQQFIHKMKEKEIDQHVKQINDQIVKKNIQKQAYESERQRLIENEAISHISRKQTLKDSEKQNEHEDDQIKKISFQELKKISSMGIAYGKNRN